MESVRVNDSGQITLPPDIMEKMGIGRGDELFLCKKNGMYVLQPSSEDPLKKLQELCKGMADELGLKTEEDVIRFSKEVRKKRAKQNANND